MLAAEVAPSCNDTPVASPEELHGPAVGVLHPAHQNFIDSGSWYIRSQYLVLTELTAEAAAKVFVASSDFSCESSKPDVMIDQSVPVHLHDQQLSMCPLDGRHVDVPLLFSEVTKGKDRATGVPMLAISRRGCNRYWLIRIRGDAEAASAMLDVMGSAGAIRSDFDASYSLVPSPIGQTPTSTIYAACRRQLGRGRRGRSWSEVEDEVEEGEIGASDYAAKVTTRHPSGQLSDELSTEVAMLSAVQDHPNILRFHGLFWLPDLDDAGDASRDNKGGHSAICKRWLLVMERYTGGILYDVVAQARLSGMQARSVIRGLLPALVHIHARGIVHRDVKPENILLAADGRAVLSDFSLSCKLSDIKEMRRKCGSPCYAAPELLSGDQYSAKVDVFSVGCVLFYMLSARIPFEGSSLAQILERTMQCTVDFGMSSCFTKVSSGCKEFILLLLRKSEHERPTAAEASKARWLCGEPSRSRGSKSTLPFLLPLGPRSLNTPSASYRPSSACSELPSTKWHVARDSLKVISSLNGGHSTLQTEDAKESRKKAKKTAAWAWESKGFDTSKAKASEIRPRRNVARPTTCHRPRSVVSSRDNASTPETMQYQDGLSEDLTAFPKLGAFQPPAPAHCKYRFCWDSKVACAAVRQHVPQGGSV